eukprot:TRINITY_DN8886_c0_g2_i7.p1 TRINITY_DN8886_c0_g2~~TRINITY_DN8886_c0_g2_i7.p1  ORF type:complete len:830 (-),score=269.03 TRINITY_DN8886_c0_g2_i7:89-2578(-)
MFQFFQSAANYLLLFQDGFFAASFWTSVALVAIWFFLVSSPLAFDQFKLRSGSSAFYATKSYQNLCHFLSSTLFVTIVVNLLKPLQCDYASGKLPASPSLVCFDSAGAHPKIVLTAMFFLAFYVTTANVIGGVNALDDGHSSSLGFDLSQSRGHQARDKEDIKYAPLYIILVNSTKVFMTAALTIFVDRPWGVLVICFLGSLFLLSLTAFFPYFFRVDASCIGFVTVLRSGGYLAGLYTVIVAFMELKYRESGSWADVDRGLVLLVGLAVIGGLTLLGAYVVIRKNRLNEDELKEMERMKEKLLRLQKKLASEKLLLPRFNQLEQEWLDDLQGSDNLRDVSLAVRRLEASMHFVALTSHFYAQRNQWLESLHPSIHLSLESVSIALTSLEESYLASRESKPLESAHIKFIAETFPTHMDKQAPRSADDMFTAADNAFSSISILPSIQHSAMSQVQAGWNLARDDGQEAKLPEDHLPPALGVVHPDWDESAPAFHAPGGAQQHDVELASFSAPPSLGEATAPAMPPSLGAFVPSVRASSPPSPGSQPGAAWDAFPEPSPPALSDAPPSLAPPGGASQLQVAEDQYLVLTSPGGSSLVMSSPALSAPGGLYQQEAVAVDGMPPALALAPESPALQQSASFSLPGSVPLVLAHQASHGAPPAVHHLAPDNQLQAPQGSSQASSPSAPPLFSPSPFLSEPEDNEQYGQGAPPSMDQLASPQDGAPPALRQVAPASHFEAPQGSSQAAAPSAPPLFSPSPFLSEPEDMGQPSAPPALDEMASPSGGAPPALEQVAPANHFEAPQGSAQAAPSAPALFSPSPFLSQPEDDAPPSY